MATLLSHFAKEKKRLRRSSLHSNPACHAHTHTLTFKMVKMVESADEFKALKMGDKPVRTLPGSAPRSRTPMSAERKCCARVFFHARAGFSVARVAIVGSAVAPAPGSRARSPRARASLPADFERARPRPPSPPTRSTPPRSRIRRRFERTRLRHSARLLFGAFSEERLETVFLFFSYDPLVALTSPLIPLIPPVTHKSSWWTSPRLGAARAR